MFDFQMLTVPWPAAGRPNDKAWLEAVMESHVGRTPNRDPFPAAGGRP